MQKKTLNNLLRSYARENNIILVKALIEAGADEFDEPIWEAAKYGYKKMIIFLLDHGAKNITCGMSAAAKYGHTKIVDLLFCQARKRKYIVDYNTVISHAAAGNKLKIINYIIKVRFSERKISSFYVPERLIKNPNSRAPISYYEKLYVNSRDYLDLNEAAASAIVNGHIGLYEELVKLGADDPNIALTAAAEAGKCDIIEYLISSNVDLDWALIRAVENDHILAAQILISNGAKCAVWAKRVAISDDMRDFLASCETSLIH